MGGGGGGGWRYTNTFPSNLNTVNLNLYPDYGGYKLEEKALNSRKNYGSTYS